MKEQKWGKDTCVELLIFAHAGHMCLSTSGLPFSLDLFRHPTSSTTCGVQKVLLNDSKANMIPGRITITYTIQTGDNTIKCWNGDGINAMTLQGRRRHEIFHAPQVCHGRVSSHTDRRSMAAYALERQKTEFYIKLMILKWFISKSRVCHRVQ